MSRVGDHDLHCVEHGSGDAVLVLLHGLSGSSRWWARNIPGLARKYRLLVPDLIGFGRSRSRNQLPTIPEAARLLLEWMTALELANVGLVGHSMGGQIAIHLAAHDSTRLQKLVLVDSAGIPRVLSPKGMIRFAAEVAPLWRWGDPRFLPTIVGDAWTAGPRVLLRAIWQIAGDDVRPLLPRITLPTLVIWGERDTLVPLRDAYTFRDEIPGARLTVLRGAAHNPMVDRPADFNRLLERFIDGEPVGR